MTKKLISIFTACCVVFVIGCARVEGVAYKYGKSDLYSKEDRNEAMEIIVKDYNSWEFKGQLKSVKYEGDEKSKDSLGYCNEISKARGGNEFVECMVFVTDFRSPKENSGPFEPDTLYRDYTWYIAREQSGSWVVVEKGYA